MSEVRTTSTLDLTLAQFVRSHNLTNVPLERSFARCIKLKLLIFSHIGSTVAGEKS